MIDWLSVVAPLPHAAPICSGHVVSIGADGEVQWQTAKRQTVEGSYSTGLQVRTCTHTADRCTHVEISGNPVKWFQGHNLWGIDDLPSLAFAMLEAVARVLGIAVDERTLQLWAAGVVQVTRVDVTESFHLGNRAVVLSGLRAAEQTAHLSHRGRGQLVKGTTLYFGKNSRRWSLKVYAKGQEIEAKGHGQDSILNVPHARDWADKTLRAELTLRSMELKRLGLGTVTGWLPVDGVPFAVSALLHERLGDMTMTTTAHLSAEILDTLRPALRMAVQSWESGCDLRAILPKATFYKFRAELLPHGIDIATLQPREAVSNVVPLHRVLEARPVGVPAWAVGTPLYFEPRRLIA
jgi:II/X family phage/plasmid replication protein